MPIPIPPWIQGATAAQFGGLFSGGMHLGAQVAEAQQALAERQQALQQEKELAEMRLQAAEKVREQDNARKMQQLEMEKAYHDQTLDIRRSELNQQAQRLHLAAQTAAQDFARQERVKSRLAAGEPAAKVLLEEGVRGAAGPALRAQEGMKEYGGIKLEDIGGGYRMAYRPGSPGAHLIPPPKTHELSPTALAGLAKAIPDLQMAARREGTNSVSAKILDKIMPLIDQSTGGGGAAPAKGTRQVRRNPKTGKFEFATEPATAPTAAPAAPGGDEDLDEEY